MADDFDPHDYRSVKNKFEGLVLAAAAKGKPDEAVAFAVEHTKDAPSLVGVLRTRMDKLQTRAGEDGLKKRMSVFVLIDGICQKEVAAGKREYQHELEPHMDTLVSAVLEADRLEKLDKSLFAHFEENLRGARRILDSWRTKGIFIGGSMLDRWINQTELVGKEFMRRKAEAEPDPKRILRKMEEDRDKQKKAREEGWMRPVGETDAMEFEAMWDAIPPIDQDDVDRLLASGEIEALDLQGYYDYRGHADDLSESLEKFAKGTAVPRNWRGNNPKENPRPPTGGVTDIHPYFAAVAERDGRTPRTFEYEVPISLQSGRYEGPASAHSASPAFPGVSPGFASPVDMPQNYGAGSGFQQTPPGLQPMSQSAGMTEGPGLAAALAGSQEHVAGSKRPRSPSPPPETKAKTAVLVLDGLLTFVDCFAPEHRGADALPMIREKGNQCDALCQAGRQLIHEMACKRFFFNELKGGRDALPKQKRPPSHWDPDTDNVSKGIPDDDCLRYRRDRMLDAYEKKFQWNAEEKERFRDYLNQVNWLLEDLPSAMRDFVQALSSQKKTRIVVVSREDHACALAKLALFGLQELAKEQDVLTDTDGYDKIGSALATGRYGEYELVVPSSFKERAALEKNPALVTGTCVVASRSDVGDVQRRFGVKPPPMNE